MGYLKTIPEGERGVERLPGIQIGTPGGNEIAVFESHVFEIDGNIVSTTADVDWRRAQHMAGRTTDTEAATLAGYSERSARKQGRQRKPRAT
jgi:hypothetical protein